MMNSSQGKVICAFLVFSSVIAVEFSEKNEGHNMGFMPLFIVDCYPKHESYPLPSKIFLPLDLSESAKSSRVKWVLSFEVNNLLFISTARKVKATAVYRVQLQSGPGSDRPAEIRPENLDNIKISVFGNGPLLAAKWTAYSYHNVKALVKDPDIDLRRKTVVYAPGYMESTTLPVGRMLMMIYKKLGYNVLLLDYVTFTSNIFPIVVRMMRPIGKHVAEMLATLTTVGLNPKKFELVGLSLGGVTMTFIAKSYREITGRNITKITALDPTGPCVRHRRPEGRLNPSDADFVLSIATNSAGYGIDAPVGHITVYINGGEYQPGFFSSYMCDNICSHMRALYVWMIALENPGSFIAIQCDSVQQAKDHNCFERKPLVTNTLDLFTDKSKPGIYYLATSNGTPFYLGKKGIRRGGAEVLNHISGLNEVDVMRV